MTWKNSLSIGVAEIDEQHKTLCDTMDRLMTACHEGKGNDEVMTTLEFLEKYAKMHFKDEEEIQNECDYPNYEMHKKLHNDFIERLNCLKNEIIQGGIGMATVAKINNFLIDWLINHIYKEDKEIARYIK